MVSVSIPSQSNSSPHTKQRLGVNATFSFITVSYLQVGLPQIIPQVPSIISYDILERVYRLFTCSSANIFGGKILNSHGLYFTI